MALRYPVQTSIARCSQFHPERRLIWYTDVMRWTIHFHDLLQVALHLGSAPFIVRWIVELLPVHWAWTSVSLDTWWDPCLINLDTHQHDQIKWLCTAILELEHALARDFVLSPIAPEYGRQYVHGRHVLCRSVGHMPSSSQAPSPRTRIISGQSCWERQIEIPFNSSTTSSKYEGDTELLMMLPKLTLRQEDMLNQMALDRSFLLFLQAGRGSILPEMILAAKEWHHQRQNSGVTCSLRQVNFLEVVEILTQRLTKLKYDSPEDPLVQALRQKGILTAENAWN